MTQYQVTVKFPKSNTYEIVGMDALNKAAAERLFQTYQNLGHSVHMHELTVSGSRQIKEAN